MFKAKKKHIEYGPPPKQLVAAIRKELRRLVELEDLDANLGMIGRFANQADDMLMVVKSPEAVMRDEHAITVPGVAQGPTNAETYGASVIQQIVPAIMSLQKSTKESPTALLEAIAMARMHGMTDVSAALEEKLLGKKLEGARPIRGPMVLPSVESYLADAAKNEKPKKKTNGLLPHPPKAATTNGAAT